jgi:hypothetical protein
VNRPREACRYCQKRHLGACPFQLVSVEIEQNKNNPAVLYLRNLLEVLFPPTTPPVQLPSCDDSSHTIPTVIVPSDPQPFVSRANMPRIVCFKCKQTGNFARDCHANRPKSRPVKPTPYMNRVVCLLCGQVGHFCKDCTHTPARPSNSPVENHRILTPRGNLVPLSLSVTSRPSKRRSQATTSIDAQTQTMTAIRPYHDHRHTTSVLKWPNQD